MKFGLPLGVVFLVLASGCAGHSRTADVSTSDPISSTNSIVPTESQEPNNTFVPKFHTHDYWAGRQSVTLFDGTVKIGQDPTGELWVDSNSVYIGRVDFDPKTDGDDGLASDKTDVVYQGTSRIDVTVSWTDSNIPGVKFSYKPANTPLYTLLGPVATGQTYAINLKSGMADMPHQLSLSRWKFRLEAFNPTTASFPLAPAYAKGDIHVLMKIINGGERFIDPPHPYFFTKGPLRYAGEVNSTLSDCVVVNNTKVNPSQPQPMTNPLAFSCPQATGADNYQAPPPSIIPWETTNALIDFYYNYTDPNGAPDAVGHKLGLKFHASDGPSYRYPTGKLISAGHMQYNVTVTEAMTDSPYATQTDWRFGVYPIIDDQKEYGGDFSGKIHIIVTAESIGASGRGMGN